MAHLNGGTVTPTLAGDFVGNWLPGGTPVAQRDSEQIAPDWDKHRQGRPLPAGGLTVAQMQEQGWVGIYLKENAFAPAGTPVAWYNEPGKDDDNLTEIPRRLPNS